MNKATSSQQQLAFKEFIALMALLMSLVALGIDAMLPALQAMGQDLSVSSVQDLHLVITILFLGMAIGQIFYGPLSDQIGRKKSIYLGLFLFIAGSLLSWFAQDFHTMLAGRFLQGLGSAGSKIVVVAMIRDLYAGASMARIMSFIMGIFILVPVLAPTMGQMVFLLWGWRAIFFSFILLGGIGGLWLALRQKETLKPEKRIAMTPKNIWSGISNTLSTPTATGYMLASGLVFGPFVGYLSSAQQIFQTIYQVGEAFPYYFGALAASIGAASLLNGRIVMSIGMGALVNIGLIASTGIAILFLILSSLYEFAPPFELFFIIFLALFFALGLLFGNMNSLAMEEVGEVAGIASALIGSISTLLSMLIAWTISHFYNDTLMPLTIAFIMTGLLTLFIVNRITAAQQRQKQG
ncbi:MAG: multidrug effflux MFS transporter [Cohaesibacter sp.]|nr:multidrug effflux MFS transporter [Cohaesibacter sp.]MCV6601138.1 multidrug effflux MFS transporter [Cohaesibacter sp.]